MKMEATAVEVEAKCGHSTEVRFPEGATPEDRSEGLAQVAEENCGICESLCPICGGTDCACVELADDPDDFSEYSDKGDSVWPY